MTAIKYQIFAASAAALAINLFGLYAVAVAFGPAAAGVVFAAQFLCARLLQHLQRRLAVALVQELLANMGKPE